MAYKIELSVQHVKIASICYLAAPLFVWLMSWLHAYASLPLIMALLYAIIRGVLQEKNDFTIKLSAPFLFFVSMASIIWVVTSGLGGFGLQNTDFSKHNAIFKLLYQNSWPVLLDETGDAKLVYYTGFYLIPSLIGKLFGWFALNIFSAMWAGIGVFLSLIWVTIISGRSSFFIILGFIFFSGLDSIGKIFVGEFISGKDHIEWWAGLVAYNSNTTLLFWVPQHALVAWIATASLISDIKNKNYNHIGLWGGVSVIWSPFVALGLLPFYILAFIKSQTKVIWISVTNFILLPLLAFVYLGYFLSIEGSGAASGFTWNVGQFSEDWYRYFLFYLFEILILAIFVDEFKSGVNKNLYYVSLASLLIFPLYRYGFHNDLALRSSLPSLFIFCIVFLSSVRAVLFDKKAGNTGSRHLLFVVMAFAVITPLTEIARSLSHINQNGLLGVPRIESVLLITDLTDHDFYKQYIGYDWPVYFKDGAGSKNID